MRVLKQFTIEDLYRACEAEIKAGNGDKKVLISDDEEYNGFHQLNYGFCPAKDEECPLDFFTSNYMDMPKGVTSENVHEFVILG